MPGPAAVGRGDAASATSTVIALHDLCSQCTLVHGSPEPPKSLPDCPGRIWYYRCHQIYFFRFLISDPCFEKHKSKDARVLARAACSTEGDTYTHTQTAKSGEWHISREIDKEREMWCTKEPLMKSVRDLSWAMAWKSANSWTRLRTKSLPPTRIDNMARATSVHFQESREKEPPSECAGRDSRCTISRRRESSDVGWTAGLIEDQAAPAMELRRTPCYTGERNQIPETSQREWLWRHPNQESLTTA